MKRIMRLATCLIAVTCTVAVMALPADAMDREARLKSIDREMDCLADRIHEGVGWNDVCYTSEGKDKERLVTKSMDQVVQEHQADSQEALKDSNNHLRTIDTVAEDHGAYADTVKSVDDTIKEQGIYDEQPETTINADENNAAEQNNLDSSRAEQPRYTQYAKNFEDAPDRSVSYTREESFTPASINDHSENQNVAEVGFEYNWQRYEEPVFDLVDKGSLYGGYVSYTARPGKNDTLYDDIVDMYKVELRGAYGLMDYSSAGSGTLDNNHDWVFEARGVAGKDFRLMADARLTPYAGFGFRYLNDDSSGRATSTGALGYERESRYFYIPVGVELTKRLGDSFLITPNAEYDIFISGTQDSHLSDVNSAFPDVKNKQRHGFGVRGSIKFVKEMRPVNLVFEPFIRYWHIEDSDTATVASSTFLISGMEPENKTTEYGVRLGAQF